MFKRKNHQPAENLQEQALRYIRSLTDDEWKTFKKASDSYRKSDKILSGEDDDDIVSAADDLIET